jgi:hypothetical protein
MIVCPICGRATAVTETRATGAGSRRRRKCTDLTCAGRVTTVEIVVDRFHQGASELADGRAILVSRRTIVKLQQLVAALGATV